MVFGTEPINLNGSSSCVVSTGKGYGAPNRLRSEETLASAAPLATGFTGEGVSGVSGDD